MNKASTSPLLRAAPLWAKTSAKGGQYLTGRLGGVKVLVMENRDRQSDDDPSHHLFIAEAPGRRQDAQERVDGQRAQAPPASQRPSQAPRSGFQGRVGVDEVDAPEWAR